MPKTRSTDTIVERLQEPSAPEQREINTHEEAGTAVGQGKLVSPEALPLGYQSLDEDGRLIDVNSAWMNSLGYARSEVLGRRFGEFLVPASLGHFVEALATIETEGRIDDVELNALKRDGSRITVSFDARAERGSDGSIRQVHCIVRDVTERRRDVVALRDSEERFRNIVDLSEAGYFFIDIGGRFRYVNDAWLQMHGNSARSEIVGAHFSNEQIEPPASEIQAAIQRVIDGVPVRSWEITRSHKDGTARHLILSCNRVSKKGEAIGIEGFALDITDIKRTREDLAHIISVKEKFRALLVSLNSCHKLTDALPMILENAIEMCQMDGGAIYMVHGEEAVVEYRRGLPDHFMKTVDRMPLNSPSAKMVMESSEAVDLVGIFMDRQQFRSQFGLRHGYSTALRIDGRVIGFLNLGSARDHGSGRISQQTLTLIGHEIESVLERLQAEEQLRRSEEKLRTVVNLTYDWEYWKSNDGLLMHMSPSCERITGYTVDDFMQDPELTLQIVHSADLDIVRRHYGETFLSEKTVRELEFRLVTRSGDIRWLSHSCQPVYDDHGKLAGRHSSNRDITVQKEAETRLAENQQRLETLLGNLQGTAYSFRLGENPSLEFVSDGCIELTGFKPSELTGKRREELIALIPPDDFECLQLEIRSALCRNRAFRIQHRFVAADRTEKWVMNQGKGIRSSTGEIQRVEGFAHDITDRVAAEAALLDSELKFKAIFNSSIRARVLLGRGMTIQAFNELARALIYKISGKEIMNGESISDFIPEILKGSFLANFRRAVSGERAEIEHRLEIPDSEHGYFVAEYMPVYNDLGDVIGVCMSISDITKKKQEEAERHILEQRVLHAQKLESLGVLAGGIAHDFNNLLMGILGNVELASACTRDQSELDECLREITAASHRAVELTSQMLAYAGRGVMLPELTDLSRFIRERTEILDSSAKKHRLTFELSSGLPSVEVDRAQIEQVIINLVTNAAEAIGDSPGQIVVRTRTAALDEASLSRMNLVESIPPGNYVILEVQDNGSGMDEATVRRIFEPFFSTKFTGRGLGLAAVLGIVRIHRGSIEVSSNPGAGASVSVFLPFRVAQPAVQEIEDDARAERSSNTILVIDDEKSVRNVTTAVLERAGYETLVAASGAEGLEALRRNRDRIRAVILDIVMPEMSGPEALRLIRETAPGMPILLVSGYCDYPSYGSLPTDPSTSFIQKPFGVADLTHKLGELLSIRDV